MLRDIGSATKKEKKSAKKEEEKQISLSNFVKKSESKELNFSQFLGDVTFINEPQSSTMPPFKPIEGVKKSFGVESMQ